MTEQSLHQTAALERTLDLRDLILLIVGTVIGSGIFIVPGAVLRQVQGSVALAMLVWLAGGILSLLGALTYGIPVDAAGVHYCSCCASHKHDCGATDSGRGGDRHCASRRASISDLALVGLNPGNVD